MDDKCPLCNHGDRADLERLVLRGEMSKRDLAEHLDSNVQVIWEHFKSHMAPSNLTSTDSKRGVLTDSIFKLQNFADRVYSAVEVDRATVQQLPALLSEMRQAVRTLQELEDGKKQEQHISIEQYNDFRSLIVAKVMTTYPKLCPTCQKLWDSMLKELEASDSEQPLIIETTGRVKSIQ